MIQDKIFFDEKDPTGLNYNTPFTFYGSYEGRLYSKAPSGSIKFYTQNSDLSVFATTGSNQFEGNQAITGSLVVTEGITGTATTASHVTYANVANKPTLVSGSSQVSFTGIINKPTLVSGSSQVSYSGITNKPTLVSSSVQVLNYGVFATTGSNGFNGSQSITGSLTVTGQVIAQTINVQQVTSSIVYSSGSNIFGNNSGNTHQFTGSLNVNGQGTFYQPLNNSTAYLTVQNNRARNAAVYTQTTSGGFYAGTSIGTDTFNYQIYDGVAGSARLTIASTGAATFSSGIATLGYTASTSYAALFNGSVGIGLTGPRSILEIQKTSGNTSIGVASNASLTLSQGGAINELSQINFGYTATNSPAVIGYITTSATDNTKGSLIFATRDVTTDSVPTTRLTIASTGAATFSSSVTATSLILNGSDNTIITQIKSASGMLQVYPYFTAADGPIIQALDGAAANLKNLRIECIATTIKGPNSVVTDGSAANINLHTTTAQGANIGGTIGFGGLFNASASTEFAVIAGKKENASINNIAGYLAFYTRGAATDPIERMRITSGGNVGIGTLTPGTPLDVFNNAAAGDNVAARFRTNFSSTNGQGVSIEFADISPTIFGKIMCTNQSSATQRALAFLTYTSSNTLTEKVRIEGNGNVGIGTPAPQSKLQINSPGGSTVGLTGHAALRIAGSTLETDQIVFGYSESGGYSPAVFGYIATTATAYQFGDLFFATRSVTSNTAPAERMRITSTGAIVHDGLNVRKTKSGSTSVSFVINLGATGYWAPGYATIRVSATRSGLQEHYAAMYFVKITYYQGSLTAPTYNVIGDTGSASINVTNALVSGQSQITITVSDVGASTDYIIADIDASFQTGIASIT